jgi:ankyrin repeat protein
MVLNGVTPDNGRPAGSMALHMACSGADHEEQRAAIVNTLLGRSVDIDARTTTCGSTPLMKAAGTAAFHLVGLLLEHRASVNAQNNRGQTAVDMAKASNKRVEAVLLEAGGRPSARWQRGGSGQAGPRHTSEARRARYEAQWGWSQQGWQAGWQP